MSGPTLPTAVWLRPPTPNPTRTGAEFHFGLPRPGRVSLSIHDIVGREVVTLFRGGLEAGEQVMRWNGQDALTGTVATLR